MFIPHRIIFENGSLEYPLGNDIYERFKDNRSIQIIKLSSNRIMSAIPGEDIYEKYRQGKKTLVVGIKKSLKFQTCKPSAHYQLPLVSGCIGQCEYCYLNTHLGEKPFVRVYVNIDDILKQAQKYIDERNPDITVFEGAATSDPVPVEEYTGSLRKSIEYFGNQKFAKFRFVTKYNDIDSLLNVSHKGHTEIRFTLNTDRVIEKYEHYTPSPEKRIEAAVKLIEAGYPIGFIIAPVFIYENWKHDYKEVLDMLRDMLPDNMNNPVGFEVISHRYTTRAKNIILQIFPETTLPMEDEDRKFKYGQFGYGKFLYTKEQLENIKNFFEMEIGNKFLNKDIKYII